MPKIFSVKVRYPDDFESLETSLYNTNSEKKIQKISSQGIFSEIRNSFVLFLM